MGVMIPMITFAHLSPLPFDNLDAYNIVWDSPSRDARGSMPLGNGDITLNLWVEDGALLFYIGKSDAWDDNNRLVKVGKVRFAFDPNPFHPGGRFRQELRLRTGEVVVQAVPANDPSQKVEIHAWVDANHPVIYVTIEAKKPLSAIASIELWRRESVPLPSLEHSDIYNGCPNPPPTIVEPDVVLDNLPEGIGWYHRNVKSVGPDLTMRWQDLLDAPWRDPLIHRIFGAIIRADNAHRIDNLHLESPASTRHCFRIYVLTKQPASEDEWLSEVRGLIKKVEGIDFNKRREAHCKWWADFWNRSWIWIREREEGRGACLPKNEHPLLIGMDQAGGSKFNGVIQRISLVEGVLSPERIRELARGDTQPLKGKGVLLSLQTPAPGTKVDLEPSSFSRLSCEAWIKLEEDDKGGRILDKITPGGQDGFLLDTWPGKSLRLIVGNLTIAFDNVLQPGKLHHVCVTFSPVRWEVYLDGELLQRTNTPAYDVTLGYTLQRFITACAGRGAYPIKFNGSLFTMPWPDHPIEDADYRRWGPGYWWQNTRLPYYSLCSSGDYDLLQPFFRMYVKDILPICEYRTKRYFGFDGAYFPECMYTWGACFMADYGWDKPAMEREDKLQEARWHKWLWVGGLELCYIMLDYYEHTQDEAFWREYLLPTALAVIRFFNNFYRTDINGKLLMKPSQALETWWDCINPMPEIAGLQAVTQRLLGFKDKLPSKDREFLGEFRRRIPPLPMREVEGVRVLAPAQEFATKMNIENPELYAVFPFRLVSFEKPNAKIGVETLKRRLDRGNFGWRQDDIFMVYLGLARDAKEYIVGRARMHDPSCRFPAFWGPNYDWTPDQDHGSVLMKALQSMLLQTEGRKIFLFPAWPREWDVDFKLHAPYNTVVEGRLEGGKLVRLKVTPKEREKDVVIRKPQ